MYVKQTGLTLNGRTKTNTRQTCLSALSSQKPWPSRSLAVLGMTFRELVRRFSAFFHVVLARPERPCTSGFPIDLAEMGSSMLDPYGEWF
jgi:hypothetical protein